MRAARALAGLAGVGFVAAIVASLVPVWPLALFEHFRVQYAVGGLLVVIAVATWRPRGYLDAAAIAWVVNLTVLMTGVRGARPVPASGTHVRVLLLNVLRSSAGFDRVAQLIADTQPDVIGLVEVDQRWADGLARALEGYARIEELRDNNFGLGLYARGQLTGGIEVLGDSHMPSVVATVETRGVRFAAIVTHPFPPVSARTSAQLVAHLDHVAARARGLGAPVLVMGDLNTTPWSRAFARFVVRSGLCDTRDGFGIQATFPASSWLVRIPIDHAFATCEVGVTERRVERDVGSDHLPVVFELVFPK